MKNMIVSNNKKYKWLYFIMVLGVVLINVKSVFVDYNVDSEYAVTMAYRMVRGDRMLSEMWEPHQTSAFLCALFIKIYLALFHSTTGIILYLHFMGLTLKCLVILVLFRTMKLYVKPKSAYFMCLVFGAMSPKGTIMPEFANMQIWFSVCMFCSLIYFLNNQHKKFWLILTGVFLCLEVLAYPSCVIVYIGVLFILFKNTKENWKNVICFSLVCVLIGTTYILWISQGMPLAELIYNIEYIIMGDASHGQPIWYKLGGYVGQFAGMVLKLLFFGFLSCVLITLINLLIRKNRVTNIKKNPYILFGYLLLGYGVITSVLAKERYEYILIFIPILFMTFRCKKYCDSKEQLVIRVGLTISIGGFVATLLLSNMTLEASMSYLILAVCVSVIPALYMLEQNVENVSKVIKAGLIWGFCALLIFRGGYIITPMSNHVATIFQIEGVVRSGPAMGMISTYMGPHIINISMDEWKEYVKEGDKVLLVGKDSLSTIGYLYEDVSICASSTISTPTFDEKILEYWNKNPEKYPNVVIIDSWFGDLSRYENSWIMHWLESEFEIDEIKEGQYWRYYRRSVY